MTTAWSSNVRLAGALLLASGLVNIIFNTVAEGSYPGYSLRTNALSDLGAVGAPTALLWDGQLFVTGILSLAGIVLFFRSSSLKIPRRRLTSVLYLLPPTGTIVVSLVPENTILAIHTGAALLIFTFGGISAMYAYRLISSPFRYFSLIIGIISLAATPLLGFPSIVGFGLAERLVVYPLGIWNIAFGSYLMSL